MKFQFSMLHINFIHEEAKRNHLIDEILRNLKLNNNHAETTKDIEKEISYLEGELANTNQLLSNLRNKNSTCFTQGNVVPLKPTEESNENTDFAIDTPPQCLNIPLNSTNYDEGDDLLKTKPDAQLKEIGKCHHQKYLDTKPIINNINKSNCLEQKCELIIGKE